MKLIDKDAVLAEINKRMSRVCGDDFYAEVKKGLYRSLIIYLNSLEVKEVDLELIIGWFDHIAQIANDRKTLNGDIMDVWAAFDEIKCLAKNSSEFIQRHYKAQKGEEV